MALSALIQWECQTGGNDTFGGGFKAGASGVDYSLTAPTVAHATLTTLSVVNATTTKVSVSLTDYTVHANDVGNVAQLSVNGGAYAFFQIDAVDTSAANTWTMDRAVGTAAQTVVGKMGGAFATPGFAAPAATINGQRIWVKAGTYTLSTATPGAGGPVVLASSIAVIMEGYSGTRGDRAGRPQVNAGSQTSINIFAYNGNASQHYVHFQAHGNSGASVIGFNSASARPMGLDCVATDCVTGFTASQTMHWFKCQAVGCTTAGFGGAGQYRAVRCAADACGQGFVVPGIVVECVATDCTGDGFEGNANTSAFMGCTAEGNTGDGFDVDTGTNYLVGCVATNNGGYGYNGSATTYLDSCASVSNTPSRAPAAVIFDNKPIILSGDPWTDASTDDLRPDSTANEGALLRAIANVGVAGQTDNRDVGAVQHSDVAGGGGRPEIRESNL